MATLHFLKFNNYFNRELRVGSELSYYEPYILASVSNYNFVPGNRIMAELPAVVVSNWSLQPDGSFGTDYLVVEMDDGSLSRWFVTTTNRALNGVWSFGLLRDVAAESALWDDGALFDVPMIIQRGIAADDNPYVFGDEGVQPNQIKVAEQTLPDSTGCQWIVGYFARYNYAEDGTTRSLASYEGRVNSRSFDLAGEYSSWDNYPYNTYFENSKSGAAELSLYFQWADHIDTVRQSFVRLYPKLESQLYKPLDNRYGWVATKEQMVNAADRIQLNRAAYLKQLNSDLGYDTTSLMYENGKIYKIGSKYYRIGVKYTKTTGNTIKSYLFGTDFFKLLSNDLIAEGATYYSGYKDTYKLLVEYELKSVQLTKTEVAGNAAYWSIPTTRMLSDQIYDMFAIPYGAINFGGIFTTNAALGLDIANDIVTTLTSSACYDIQLLPYCPVSGLNAKLYEYNASRKDIDWSYITDGQDNPIGAIWFLGQSDFRKTVEITDQTFIDAAYPTNRKIDNLTTFVRLNAPDYSATYEFVPAKNDNEVLHYNIDVSLRPNAPHIHVAPVWGGLYGRNWEDARGLICNEFSLPRTDSEWASYVLNNKNYQKAFDRQIESQKMQNDWALGADIANAIVGIGSGVVGGSLKGGVAGGIIGGVAGAIGGGLTVGSNAAIRNEQLNLAKDQFELSNGNVQARPDTLTRAGGQNIDNKKFPFAEVWTCTDAEKDSLAKSIAVRGMTIGATGTLHDYVRTWNYGDTTITHPFVQAKTLQLPFSATHPTTYEWYQQLANELSTGLYVVDVDGSLPTTTTTTTMEV